MDLQVVDVASALAAVPEYAATASQSEEELGIGLRKAQSKSAVLEIVSCKDQRKEVREAPATVSPAFRVHVRE